MKKYVIYLFFLSGHLLNAQDISFKSHVDTQYNFSFQIPENWSIIPEEQRAYSNVIACCQPELNVEKASYEDCYEGIIFRISCHENSFEKDVELKDRFENINGKLFATIGPGNSEVKFTQGVNSQIYYHNTICGITCEEEGYLAAAGECEYLYFSNKYETIEIATNGRSLDKIVFDAIIKSFVFD